MRSEPAAVDHYIDLLLFLSRFLAGIPVGRQFEILDRFVFLQRIVVAQEKDADGAWRTTLYGDLDDVPSDVAARRVSSVFIDTANSLRAASAADSDSRHTATTCASCTSSKSSWRSNLGFMARDSTTAAGGKSV